MYLSVRIVEMKKPDGFAWVLYNPTGSIACHSITYLDRASTERELMTFLYNFNMPGIGIVDLDPSMLHKMPHPIEQVEKFYEALLIMINNGKEGIKKHNAEEFLPKRKEGTVLSFPKKKQEVTTNPDGDGAA